MATATKEAVIGIDIGGTNTKIAFVDRSGRKYAHRSFSTHAREPLPVFLKHLKEQVADMHLVAADDHLEVRAIGVGAPQANQLDGTLEHPPNIDWGINVPLQREIEDLLGLPTVIANDANAAAVGEMHFGSARGLKNFIVVTLGTGLGSGIVINGKLLLGQNGIAGEMGHMLAKEGGRKCGCGNFGCLETYASATGIKRTIFKFMADMNELSTFRALSYNDLTANQISDAALRGDAIAQQAFAYTGKFLGANLADVIALFDPEAVIISGGLSKAGDLLLRPTLIELDKHLFPAFRGKTSVFITKMSDANAAVLGAAGMAFELLAEREEA